MYDDVSKELSDEEDAEVSELVELSENPGFPPSLEFNSESMNRMDYTIV